MSGVLRVGMAGLGRGARIVLPWFDSVEGVELSAVADPRPEALEPFVARELETYQSVQKMCESDAVDAIWIATPSEFHAEHAVMAADNGKHIVCEKPMALDLAGAQRIIEAIERSGVKYVQRARTYHRPIRKMRAMVESGELGHLVQINSWNYRGWLVRYAFLAREFDTSIGGGLLMRQGPHQVDIVRCIGGGMIKSVRSMVGRWSPDFDTEGNYSAYLEFEDGTPALVSNNAYGFFDTAELTWGIGEGGPEGLDQIYERTFRRTGPADPEEKYGSAEYRSIGRESPARGGDNQPRTEAFYGLTIMSCEQGDVRQTPTGLYVYTKDGRNEIPCEAAGAANELEELRDAVAQNRPPSTDAYWGMATLEVLLAIRQSAAERREVYLQHQTPYRS